MHRRLAHCIPTLSKRYIFCIFAAAALALLVLNLRSAKHPEQTSGWAPSSPIGNLIGKSKHPIDQLVTEADRTLQTLIEKRTAGVSAAAKAYRARRGRHPPPEFDRWVEYAEENNALIVEEFFDDIYNDLEPFWSLPSKEIRTRASKWPNIVSVRRKVARVNRCSPNLKKKLQWRVDMLKLIQRRLPDVDLAISVDKQQAIVVPWENINEAMAQAGATRRVPLLPPASVPFNNFAKLREIPRATDKDRAEWKSLWYSEDSYWEMVRNACHPDGAARSLVQDNDFAQQPVFPDDMPQDSHEGFVGNWTESKSPCVHPELRNLHGTLVGPGVATRHAALFPLFADSKIQDVNNVIVFPARYSWEAERDYPEMQWDEKKSKLLWRGPASGGHHNKINWGRFHRHRFVAMTNSSWVTAMEGSVPDDETNSDPPVVFPLPWNETWSFSAMRNTPSRLGQWVEGIADVGFTNFICNPATEAARPVEPSKCDYVQPYYKIKKDIDMPDLTRWKYLADIDADGSSGKFLKLLRSNSMPLKATIFSEWHDKRLIPWKHFVPIDNTFVDLWPVMEYFVGFDDGSDEMKKEGRDRIAKAIAEQGQEWARRVLRREDVLVYVYRLILEYARLCDDRRDNMGYVKDLVF